MRLYQKGKNISCLSIQKGKGSSLANSSKTTHKFLFLQHLGTTKNAEEQSENYPVWLVLLVDIQDRQLTQHDV